LDPTKAGELYSQVGKDYVEVLLQPEAASGTLDVSALVISFSRISFHYEPFVAGHSNQRPHIGECRERFIHKWTHCHSGTRKKLLGIFSIVALAERMLLEPFLLLAIEY